MIDWTDNLFRSNPSLEAEEESSTESESEESTDWEDFDYDS